MTEGIDPTARVHPTARIAADVVLGPYCIIGADVEIGAGTTLAPHVVIDGPTVIGRDCRIHAFCALGGEPQDKKYGGESSRLVVGDRNTIREYCTFNRGTGAGGGETIIGDDNWIMAYVHVAHDCVVGNHVIFANAASLAGHVRVDDHAILGGFTLVHQFCQIGAHAFTSMGSVVNRDVPPYVMVAGAYAQPRGINSEGLRRRGFSAERVKAIKTAYRTLYKSGLPLADALARLRQDAGQPDIDCMLDFIARSERSLVR